MRPMKMTAQWQKNCTQVKGLCEVGGLNGEERLVWKSGRKDGDESSHSIFFRKYAL